MKFYAYVPRPDGSEPMGTGNRHTFDLKTKQGAIRHAVNYLGPNVKLFSYTNLYDQSTFNEIQTKSPYARNPQYKGKTLALSTQDMRIILNVLDVKTGDRYTQKIVKDAIRHKIIRLAPEKYEGWEWVKSVGGRSF
jgi:hypothetical protein